MKQAFLTEKGPKAVGPYSTAVIHQGTAYLSGMIPMDPVAGKIVEGGIEAQTHQVFKNILAVLEEMGLTMDDVVKVSVFLTNMSDFAAVNAIYATYFSPPYPARSCVQVAALPMGVEIEIEILAAAK